MILVNGYDAAVILYYRLNDLMKGPNRSGYYMILKNMKVGHER